jgi:hypothetical protein
MNGQGAAFAHAVAAIVLLGGCSVDDRTLSTASSIVGADASHVEGGSPALDGTSGGSGGGPSTQDGATSHDASAGGAPASGGCHHVGSDGAPDCGDTLVANADFDRDVTGWPQADAFGSSAWNSKDSQNAAGSGSIAVTNTYVYDASGLGVAAAGQCIPAKPGKTYDFAADIYIPPGQDYGIGEIAVWFYPAANCDGNPDGAYLATTSDVTDKWTHADGTLLVQDQDQSMSVRLGAEKPFRNKKLEVLFDAIRVTEQ